MPRPSVRCSLARPLAGKQPLAYGRADQPKLQAAKRKRKAAQRESAAKLPARGRGRGGRGGRVLEFPDSSEEEELGEDDVEDDCSSSPSLSDSED